MSAVRKVFQSIRRHAPFLHRAIKGAVPANSRVTVKGTNLAAQTDELEPLNCQRSDANIPRRRERHPWRKAGVRFFISPGQVNVLAPDLAAGPVGVTVTTAGGSSTVFATT